MNDQRRQNPAPSAPAQPVPPNHDQPVIPKYVKITVFVGIFLLRILDGIPWVWGNLNVYVTSYYYSKGDDSSGSSINWLLSIDNFGFNLGLLIGGLISRNIGIRLTLFLAVIAFNGGIIFSYFALQASAIALCTTFGALTGISGGIVENCQLTLIVRWTNRYKGLAASTVPSMNILGAVVINYILTVFINPYNAKTDDVIDDISIFTQSELVDRVPYSFLLYGCMSLALNMVGFFLIRINRGDDNFIFQMISKCKTLFSFERPREESVHFNIKSSSACYESLQNNEEEKNSHEADISETKPVLSTTYSTCDISNDAEFHFTPKEALRTRAFYVLWAFSAMLNFGFFTLNTYYKSFGLMYIHDDHFLTVVVMVKCLATPLATFLAGFSVDSFGFKRTLVLVSGLYCVIAGFYYVTTVSRWLYLLSTVFYGCALFSLFCLTSACCVKLYGQSHFSTIFGMIQTFSNITTLVNPPLTRWVLSTHGWLVLFTTVGVLALCQTIILALGLPSYQYYKQKQKKNENQDG